MTSVLINEHKKAIRAGCGDMEVIPIDMAIIRSELKKFVADMGDSATKAQTTQGGDG